MKYCQNMQIKYNEVNLGIYKIKQQNKLEITKHQFKTFTVQLKCFSLRS